MDDAGTGDMFQFRRVVQQGIEQSAFPVAGSRMHHQPGRLVDHDDRIVLVDDVQIHRLGPVGLLGRMVFDLDLDPLRAPNLCLAAAGDAVDQDAALIDPLLDAVAGIVGQQLGQALVQTAPGVFGGNRENEVMRHPRYNPAIF